MMSSQHVEHMNNMFCYSLNCAIEIEHVKRVGLGTAERNQLLSLASHLTLLKKAQSFNL